MIEDDDLIRSGQEIGEDHYIRRQYLLSDGRWFTYPLVDEPVNGTFIGLTEHHKRPTGKWCGGWIGFKNVEGANPNSVHELISADPLTVRPSLACRLCPNHGFIRTNRWVPV